MMTESTPYPEIFEQISDGVYQAIAMISGVRLDLFTPLKDGPLSAVQIAEAIRVDPPKLRPLLYALVVTGLLTVDGELFANTAEANYYLVRDRPDYIGNRLEYYVNLWNITFNTAESIRTGKAQEKWDYTTMPRDQLESTLRGLYYGTLRVGRTLAEKYDFSACRTLVDVGGGSGGLAIGLTEVYPDIKATVVDLPQVTPVTQQLVSEAGATDRVQVMATDVVRQSPKGSFDVAVMKAFINVLSPEAARQALRNIYQALNAGGSVYIVGGLYLDDSRLSPPLLVTFNLLMLNIYDDGQLYTEQEHRAWLTEAGFEAIEHVPGMGYIARKPA